jgi:hypothetical protein
MGIWFVDPQIAPDEKSLYRVTANHLLGTGRALGGKLVVTSRRVLFAPNRLDQLTGGKAWAVDITAVQEIAVAPGGKEGIARYGPAGARPQVVVTADAVEPGVFVVRDPNGLRSAIEGSRAGASDHG